MADFNEEFRFGSARWATAAEVRRAGLFKAQGRHLGYFGGKPINAFGDASLITIGGAGSGKFKDQIAFLACNSPGQRALFIDPRGEASAVSRFIHVLNNESAYDWTPIPMAGRPSLSCNPLDILDPNAPTFISDCKMLADSLLVAAKGKDPYWIGRAQEWVASFLKFHVERYGKVTFRDLVRIMNAIESDADYWTSVLQAMMASPYSKVQRVAGEMLNKQTESSREFGSILSELYNALGILDDENLLRSLDGTDFSLKCLTDPHRVCKVFLNTPAEYLGIWAGLLRIIFEATMLAKARKPDASRVLFVIDEAGQLGKFEAMLRSVTFGRGAGITTWTFWQDIGQISRNFDREAVQTFLGSAQYRQVFGARDLETAKMVSEMCGTQTLTFDDELRQGEAKRLRRKIAQNVMLGKADPMEAGHHMAQLDQASKHRSKQQRRLILPEEVMALGEDEQLIFASGLNLPPIKANKFGYFTRQARKQMAGKYLDSPYHAPPPGKEGYVRVHHWYGARWHKIIRERVPASFRQFAQYADGGWEYLDGFYSRS
ncbi:type IV secretory system conjugative DNA transfer family protein [Ahrensia sp. R2A130]|uniref:type IV secretory system conjugative DNA transfer family protein n=1 Tax=Ahrensia sp. R2A130 TaxID=744979 RepID=UPI0001E0C306|nr:type IV secretory system conjugative DNA transfer family protein [Ahrensia sp. R2A130]EFL90215.1 TraG/TraD family protein [Ahrensia sp. R2A130]